jgi:hypothetical protein
MAENSSNATPRCPPTTPGSSSFHTVSAPSRIWAASSTTASVASPPSRARSEACANTQPTVVNSITLTSRATSRWNHSTSTLNWNGGIHRP